METQKGRLAKELEDPFYLKDPKILDLYNKCLPPKEAYLYFPKGEKIIEFNHKNPKKTYRKIYHNVPFLDNEKQYITEFKQILNNHPEVKLPEFFDDALLLRFIYADECEMEKVFKRLVKYIDWSNKTFPITIHPKSKLIEILNKGFVYAYGRDCRFRPILIFRAQEFVKNQKSYSVEEVVEAGAFLGQFVLNNMMIPGKIERWNLLISLKGAHVLSLPEHIKKLVPVMNEAFISRLHKNYIIGMTFFLRVLFKIICAFLHESTIKKIKILSGKKDQSLFEEIRKDNIEEYFGGTAPDVHIGEENGLFPPRMPSDKFMLDSDNPQNLLISEEEYIKKYNDGEIPEDVVSPYLKDKLNLNKKNEENIEKQEIIEDVRPIFPRSNTETNSTSKNIIKKNNNNININAINMKINKKKKSSQILTKQQQNINRIKTFVYQGWEHNSENIEPEKYQSSTYNRNNFINNIHSLTYKRNKFFSKISLVSNQNSFNKKNNFS